MQLPLLLNGLTDQAVPDLAVTGITSDSRNVAAGNLFVALAGYGATHAISYAEQAVAAGAIAVIWEPNAKVAEAPELSAAFVLAMPDLQAVLGVIASRFYGEPSQRLAITGITGTDGKTSCAWLLNQAWNQLGENSAMIGTLGKGRLGALERGSFTTPFPIELQSNLARFETQGVSNVAVEVSSHALDQNRVAATRFEVAVLTNLSRDHLDYHGSEENYAAAKQRLFTGCEPSVAVLNTDDAFGAEWAGELKASGRKVLTYGLENADVTACHPEQNGGLSFTLHYQNSGFEVHTSLLGDFNIYNLLAVATVLLAQGVELSQVAQALRAIKAPPGRLEMFEKQRRVVVDYAHTPGALEAALLSLRKATDGLLVCVFGCGGDRDRGKRELMAQAAERLADVVWVTDDNPRNENPEQIFADIREGFAEPEKAQWVHDRGEAIDTAISSLAPEDILLVAGKGHEDYQLVGPQRLHFSDREFVAKKLGVAKPEALYA